MHHLVPPYILEQWQSGNSSGSFSCAALFVDISGFTSVTETLMEHGQYGAEILAVVMRMVFTPLIQNIYKQGGFVTGFAGDAFTAVFHEEESLTPAQLRALAAAWQMQQHMKANNQQETRFGTFEFSAKVGLAHGDSIWGILTSEDESRATYYFRGSAIDGCAQSESHAMAGEILTTNSFFHTVQEKVSATPVKDHWRIEEIEEALPTPDLVPYLPVNIDLASRFVPRYLLEREIEGEFRQILNLFIGLQGTPSREELNTFMQDVFRLQNQYGGFLNRIDFGDKGCHLLFFWGAPLSHEHDLAHVLDFVLTLEQNCAIPMRAGITYRIAHAGTIGSELAEEYTCYGRGVNLAARQMTSAGWGEIWLDGETAQRAAIEFAVEAVGARTFKGFAEPQEIYLLQGRREKRESRFEDKPLIGRQQELDALKKAVQPIFNGQFAGSITIIGEAGVGKSRLVDALYAPYLQRGQAAVFFCQADELLRQSLNPFRYFLARHYDQSPTAGDEVNKQRFEEKFKELLAATADPALKEDLQRAYSFLGNLLGLNWEGSLYEQLDPELRFENTLDGLKAFFKAESLRRPLILHLEDAHWWDRDSQTFLTRLTRNVQDFAFILLITSREELPEALFEVAVPQEQIQLQPLGQESVAELAQDIIGHAPSPSLVNLLQERTQGNPFFVEQILLYLQEHDLLETIETQSGTALPGDVYVPADVRAVLTARLDRLPFDIKDIVQKAAVLGQEFETPILAAMVDNDVDLEACLATGATEKVWLNSGPASYVFHHALLRDAAYDMQIGARLRQLHNRAAATYELVYPDSVRASHFAEIAFHYDRAEETKQAQHYYGAAGGHAKGEYSNEDAIAYFGRALELTDESDYEARYDYLSERETVFQWLGLRDRQRNDIEQLKQVVDSQVDDLKKADLALRQSAFALVTGNYVDALDKVSLALEYAEAAGDPLAEARAYHRQGRTLWQQGQSRDAEVYLKKALKLVRKKSDPLLETECLYDLAVIHRLQGEYERAYQFLQRAEKSYADLENKQGLVRCYNLLGIIDYESGNFLASLDHYHRALDLIQSAGWRWAESHLLNNIGNIHFEFGNYARAKEFFKQGLAVSIETGDIQAQSMSLDSLGLVNYCEGDSLKAVSYYDRSSILLESAENERDLGFVLTHRGYAEVSLDNLLEAESSFDKALHLRQQLGETALSMDTLGGLALVALRQGQINKAYEITSDILSYIDSNGTDGIELPVQVYSVCYEVLSEAAKTDEQITSQSQETLIAGNALIKIRAEQLQDHDMRRRFLENIPFNRALGKALKTDSS
jgi:predicted ATPase/class 3 adenylate cyclase